MYVVTSKFLQDGDALFFNLSTLTSDVYGVAFQVLVYRATPHWLYGVAFGCVVAGVLVYGNEPLRYTGVEAEKEEEGGRAGGSARARNRSTQLSPQSGGAVQAVLPTVRCGECARTTLLRERRGERAQQRKLGRLDSDE